MKTHKNARVGMFYVTAFFSLIEDQGTKVGPELAHQFAVIAESAHDAIARTQPFIHHLARGIVFTDVKFVAWADNSTRVDLE